MKILLNKMSDARKARKLRRKFTSRKKIIGSDERPRLCVVRSNKHVNIQLVDDASERTLCSFSSFGKNAVKGSGKTKAGLSVMAKAVAVFLKATDKKQVVLDRNGRLFGPNLAEFTKVMREEGISV
jgi:large subunit ribosomal protein L18